MSTADRNCVCTVRRAQHFEVSTGLFPAENEAPSWTRAGLSCEEPPDKVPPLLSAVTTLRFEAHL